MENHKGQDCLYLPFTCQEGYCSEYWLGINEEEATLARQAIDDDYNEQIEDLLIY